MKPLALLFFLLISIAGHANQKPIQGPRETDSIYRQFDFWVGNWEVFNREGKKAGDSKISLILDSCVVLEEWTSTPGKSGFRYRGKSFNTYNAAKGEWQQTWVDNVGNSTHYVHGGNKIVFSTDPYSFSKGTVAIQRLTFFNLGPNKIRQLGEISKDDGKTWTTQYDLEYRRK